MYKVKINHSGNKIIIKKDGKTIAIWACEADEKNNISASDMARMATCITRSTYDKKRKNRDSYTASDVITCIESFRPGLRTL